MARPPLLGQVFVEYDQAQAVLKFNADTRFGANDATYVVGTKGALSSTGEDLNRQCVTLHTAKGTASPKLKGSWFTNGFQGTMAELLASIEQDRDPDNSGADNLNGLALCFAAIASAERGRPVVPGSVKKLMK